MGVYNLFFKPSVEKDFKNIPASISRQVLKKIEQLPNNPISSQSVKLAGTENFYRVRAGDYRIIYAVDHSNKQITIHYIRHRREVYRSF